MNEGEREGRRRDAGKKMKKEDGASPSLQQLPCCREAGRDVETGRHLTGNTPQPENNRTLRVL